MKYLIIVQIVLFVCLFSHGQTQWPVQPFNQQHSVVGSIGECRESNLHYHMGVDITNGSDVDVYSIEAGTVTNVNYTGNCWSSYIDVTDGNGIRIRYFHIKTVSNQIHTGAPVNQGTLLGQMFSAGGCNLHLHLEKSDGNFLNTEFVPFADNSNPIIGTTTFCLNGATFYSNCAALSSTFNLNSEDYLLLYNKIDIISSAHDTRLTSNGGADGGYLAPFSLEYEIFNCNNQSINGPIQNFNFSDPPPNNHTQYAFSYGSILTNFSYILTNDPDPSGSEPPDKYFNTILRKNTPETWPNNSSLDAQFNNEAHFSDGIYNVTVRATDVDNGHNPRHTVTSSSKIIIDNFRPYISRVKIYEGSTSNGALKYNRGWQWANNSLQLEPQPNTAYFSQTQNIKVIITTSEPMLDVTLQVGNLTPQLLQCGAELNKNTWEFIVPIANSNTGEKQLTISGHDLANNPIQSKPSIIPIRQSNTVWTPAPNTTSEDNYHKIIYGGNIVDFIAKQKGNDYNLIEFTDNSPGYVLGSSWVFGDNRPDGFGDITTHRYATYGQYNVTHTAIVNGIQGSFTKPVSVNELTVPKVNTTSANPKFPPGGGKNSMSTIDVDFYSDCEGIISSYTWLIGGNTYNTQHPTGISLLENYEYYVTLTVENAAGTDTYTKRFYFDRLSTPYATILDWEVTYFVHDLEVSTANFNDTEPIEFTIDFGDGITETFTEDYYSYHTFTHNYYELGEYIVMVTVKQAPHTEVQTAKRIRVQPHDLDVNISYTSPNMPPRPKEQIVCNATVTGAAAGSIFYGSWGIYRVGDPNSYYSVNFPIQATHIPEFKYIPNKAGRYKVILNVNVSGFATSGYASQEIEVVNAPKYVDAAISADSYLLSLNSEYTYYGSVWPTGDPGVPEKDWNPTNIRWTLTGPNGKIVNIQFPYDQYMFTRYFTYKFDKTGTYYLQLETWNKNHQYEQNGEIDTSNNCRLSYYNYDIKKIEVKENIPSLAVVAPIPTYFQPDAGTHTLEIIISNPSTTPINWVAEYNPGCGFVDWFQILNTSGSGLCCGNQQIINVNILANQNIENRFGCIRIRGYVNGIEIQGSPAGVVIDQYGTAGPWVFFAKGSYPDNNFGYAVGMDGMTAIIGSPNSSYVKGLAYIYKKTTIGTWERKSILLSSDNDPEFGKYVDISGDNACVLGSNNIYFFRRGNSGWSGVTSEFKKQTVNGPKSVTIWGDYAVVGSPGEGSSGKVSIFYRNQGGVDNWGLVKQLVGDYGGDHFGNSVDLYNDQLAVGAPNGGQGYIKIFNRNLSSSNDWGLDQKINAPNFSTNESGTSEFGKSVSIFENTFGTTYYRWVEPAAYFGNGACIYANYYRKTESGWIEIGRKRDMAIDGNRCSTASMFKLQNIYKEDCISAFFGYPEAAYTITWGSDTYNEHFGSLLSSRRHYETGYPGPRYDFTVDMDWSLRYADYLPNDYEKYGQSVALSYSGLAVGIPGYDQVTSGQGAVEFNRNSDLGKDLCEAGINLDLVNFSKPSGTYSDIIAQNISLGGRSLPATIENGATIKYEAQEILLQDGFLADHGCTFTADAEDCSGNSDAPQQMKNLKINLEEWPLSEETRKWLINFYMHAFPDLPWQTFDIAVDADFAKAENFEPTQKSGNNGLNNPDSPEKLQNQEIPNFPVLLLNDSKIKLKIGSSITIK